MDVELGKVIYNNFLSATFMGSTAYINLVGFNVSSLQVWHICVEWGVHMMILGGNLEHSPFKRQTLGSLGALKG